MEASISDEVLSRFSGFVAQAMGLDYPPSRAADLRRGITAAAGALGFDDANACAQWLMSKPLTRDELAALAGSLTVGETYFFRDPAAFEVLGQSILPALIHARRHERRLRIWSAACCTGEEAYSIAITLCRSLPNWRDWDITILGTDLNPVFLRKAETGVYGEWSFRNVPTTLREHYFIATADGKFEILPEIRRMVRFMQLNLVDDSYPSLSTGTTAMDIIFCRNALMYFTSAQARKVLLKFHGAQAEGGWLIVAASEFFHVSSTPYVRVPFSGAVLHRKGLAVKISGETRADGPALAEPFNDGVGLIKNTPPIATRPTIHETTTRSSQSLTRAGPQAPRDPGALSRLARELANAGDLNEALACCDEWVATDKLNPRAHYLRAVILSERGDADESSRSLRRALYLDPTFILAHYAMGNLAHRRGQMHEAGKHLGNALRLLRERPPADILAESDGITAASLARIIDTMISGMETP